MVIQKTIPLYWLYLKATNGQVTNYFIHQTFTSLASWPILATCSA